MSKQFIYTSVLAPFINELIEKKLAMGIEALRSKWILKEFDDFANANSLKEPRITENFIMKWRSNRLADSERTLYAKFSIWSQLISEMVRNGCLCYIPHLPVTPNPNFTPYIFTDEQIETIFKNIDAYRLADRRFETTLFAMPVLFRLLYSTGVRISEALSIKNKDVHLDEHIILLRKTKNKSERIVPICESLGETLDTYQLYRSRLPIKGIELPDSPYFIKANGTSFRSNSVYCHFRKILNRSGIPHIGKHEGPRVHDLRHTFAVHALIQMERNGMDLYTALPILSTCLGHHSLFATEKYVRLTQAMYPEIAGKCSTINAFIYPKISITNENNN